MTTATIYSSSADGIIRSNNATYATARTGSNLGLLTSTGSDSVTAVFGTVGQWLTGGDYQVFEAFLDFDTSTIPDDAVIGSVVLSLYGLNNNSDTDFTIEARLYDWGTALATGDWIAGANLGSQTLLASFATSGYSLAGYNAFTSEAAFASNLDLTGTTRLIICSSRHRVGNEPVGAEWVDFYMADQAAQDKDPKLVVTYTVPVQHQAEASLQGVATISAEATYGASGAAAALQGVATISAGATGVPSLDFSRYDAFIEDDAGTFGVLYAEGEGIKKDTISRGLQPTRTDVGNNPYEVRPESGNMFSQGDFSHGSGQTYFHRDGADFKKYLRSEGFDISEPGVLTHLHAVAVADADVNIGAMTVANGKLMYASGTNVEVGDGTVPGAYTTEDPSGAEAAIAAQDLTSSGNIAYAALGSAGVHQRATDGTWTHYSDVAATRVAWLKDRLMAADGVNIYEITSGPAAPSALETLPAGWIFQDIFEAGAFIYATAIHATSDISAIHIYGENSGLTAIEKKGEQEFPQGQLVYSGKGYLGTVFLGAGKKNASGGYDPVLYRAVPDDTGFLEYIKIAEEEGSSTADLSVKAFAAVGESVLCGWSLGAGSLMGAARGGLAVYHLARAAFAPHLKATSAANPINDIVLHKGTIFMSVNGVGLYYEKTTLVDEASLISSVGDWNSAGGKLWDLIEVSHNPLAADMRVKVYYCTEIPDSSTSWVEALTSQVLAGDGDSVRVSGLDSRLFALKLVSEANTGLTAAPEVVSFGVRSNPFPDYPEFYLSRFIRLIDEDKKDDYAEPIQQDASGILRRLLNLGYLWVKLYEPGINWLARIESVKNTEAPLGIYDVSGDNTKDAYVVQMVLSGTLN